MIEEELFTWSKVEYLDLSVMTSSRCALNSRRDAWRKPQDSHSPKRTRTAHTHNNTHTHHTHHTHTQHTHTHHTHTPTHVGFYGLRGLSIGVMVFILYKLYVLLPYTYPTPKFSPHRRRCFSTFPPKNSLCMIYKHFELWGH